MMTNWPASGRIRAAITAQWLLTVVFVVILFALWQLATVIFEVPGYLLPAPVDVLGQVYELREPLVNHTWVTVKEIVIGFTTGTVIGISLAWAMSRSQFWRKALYLPVIATQTTPVVAIAPILVIWFGVGITPKIIVIALFAFFPVLVNTLAGLEATGRRMLDLMKSVSASEWQVYRHIRIPMALPNFFAGLRLAAAGSVIGAVVAEWVTAFEGLGYLLILYNSRLATDSAFATLLVLMGLGLVAFALTAFAESRLSWAKRLGIE